MLELLKKGVIWRVGSGDTIRIWDDPWLPRGLTRRPITPRGQNLLTYVNDLINPITEQWDKELVIQTSWEEDAEAILSIPVHVGMDDVLACHCDGKGIFSVKSSYKLFCDDIQRQSPRGRSPSTIDQEGSCEEKFGS